MTSTLRTLPGLVGRASLVAWVAAIALLTGCSGSATAEDVEHEGHAAPPVPSASVTADLAPSPAPIAPSPAPTATITPTANAATPPPATPSPATGPLMDELLGAIERTTEVHVLSFEHVQSISMDSQAVYVEERAGWFDPELGIGRLSIYVNDQDGTDLLIEFEFEGAILWQRQTDRRLDLATSWTAYAVDATPGLFIEGDQVLRGLADSIVSVERLLDADNETLWAAAASGDALGLALDSAAGALGLDDTALQTGVEVPVELIERNGQIVSASADVTDWLVSVASNAFPVGLSQNEIALISATYELRFRTADEQTSLVPHCEVTKPTPREGFSCPRPPGEEIEDLVLARVRQMDHPNPGAVCAVRSSFRQLGMERLTEIGMTVDDPDALNAYSDDDKVTVVNAHFECNTAVDQAGIWLAAAGVDNAWCVAGELTEDELRFVMLRRLVQHSLFVDGDDAGNAAVTALVDAAGCG